MRLGRKLEKLHHFHQNLREEKGLYNEFAKPSPKRKNLKVGHNTKNISNNIQTKPRVEFWSMQGRGPIAAPK